MIITDCNVGNHDHTPDIATNDNESGASVYRLSDGQDHWGDAGSKSCRKTWLPVSASSSERGTDSWSELRSSMGTCRLDLLKLF